MFPLLSLLYRNGAMVRALWVSFPWSEAVSFPWSSSYPGQLRGLNRQRCEPICRAEAFPVGGREAEQVMAALTQRGCDIFQRATNLQLQPGSSAAEEIYPVQCISRRCGRLMGLGSKWFYLWSPECGAGSLSQKHPHTPSLRQNLFVPERETYYGSNSCGAIRKRKVHESDSVGLPATLNMVINHARY